MINSLFSLIGTFVGAGFASGKEVFNFFSIFGVFSLIGIFIFSFLFFIIIYKILNLKYTFNLNSYEKFLLYLEKKYKFFKANVFMYLVNIFLLISFYIMVCALCTLFYDKFNITKYITVLVTILICYFIFIKNNIKFIYSLNLALMPVLIIFIILLGIKNINIEFSLYHNSSFTFMSLINCMLYFSYNSLLIIPILFKIDVNKKNIFKLSFWFSFIIFVLMNILNIILLINFELINNKDLPILHISIGNGPVFSFLYFFIFLSAILTTMISSGFAFCNNLNKNKKIIIISFLFFSFIFAFLSFSDLINFFYTFLGYIGLLQIILILANKS